MVKIALVGEAWGAREELFAHAFVGKAGVELARLLAQADLAPAPAMPYPSELDMIWHWKTLREEHGIEITNVFNCRPPDNKIDLFFTTAKEGVPGLPSLRPGKFLIPSLLPHLERLWATLDTLRPNLIIALGNTPCWAILGESKISTIRGTIKMSPRLGIKTLATYHPAAILYEGQWHLRPIVLSDLEKAKREADFSEVRRIERWVHVEPTLDEISNWIDQPAEFYAVDIETKVKQISMIGFARSPHDAMVIPFIDENKPDYSYWPTAYEERAAWHLADRALKKPVGKVFQNGVFDLSWLLRWGFRPTACIGDTMLLHHSLYPEMLKGLGFLGSIYSNELAWKPMRTKGDNLKRDE